MRWFGLNSAGVIALALAGGLAGCAAGGEDPGNTLGNLFAYNTTKPPPVERSVKARDVECPVVQVEEGQSAYRLYAGADHSNEGVRQQFSFGEMSRECTADESTVHMRVGISGYVQAGPAGGPGAFTVPIKVVIRRESDLQPAVVKTYRVNAAIAPGETSAPFSMVTEPLDVPFVSSAADEDYSIYVGFDAGPAPAVRKPARARRKGRAAG